MKPHLHRSFLVLVSVLTTPALATFPIQPIDIAIFDLDDASFLGEHFGFATSLSYDVSGSPAVTTGTEGFVATPEQVAAIPDFAAGVDLPTGGHFLSDLFPGGVTPMPPFEEAEISQSIRGEGDFVNGFSEVTLSQRKRLSASQADGEFADLFAEGLAFAPFEVASAGEGPVDALVTIDLLSTFFLSGGGSLSEFLGLALIDLSDPEAPTFMDGVSGFYFVDEDGPFANFGLGQEGVLDVTDNFTAGPAGTEPDSPQVASFRYAIDTQLTPGGTYGIGLFGDGAVAVDGPSTSWLDSSNTLTGTVKVLTPGARLFLPGVVVPEPTAIGLLGLGIVAAPRGRARTSQQD